MKTTFILAQKFHVTPFEIMAQDIDAVIMVINYYIEEAHQGGNIEVDTTKNEKEQDKDFWACL